MDRFYKQSKIIKYPSGVLRTIIKNDNGRVICVCGRSYNYFKSLERHVRDGCDSVVQEEQESEANKENQIVNGK